MSRRLEKDEIEIVLSVFDDSYRGLDKFTRQVLIRDLKAPIRARLQEIEVQPCMIYKLRGEIERIYRPIEAGRPVGILTAQSIGEMQTQMNLNVFHRAGYRDQQVEQSSRLQELISATRSETQSSVMAFVYYTEVNSNSLKIEFPENWWTMLKSLIHKTFRSYVIDYRRTSEPAAWENEFDNFFGKRSDKKIRFLYNLDLETLYRFRLDLATIADILSEQLDVDVTFSPLYLGEICIYMNDVSAHEEALDVTLHGISLVKNAYFLPKSALSTETFIETEGSNLKEILYLPFVDSYNTVSNDVWEIYALFGIEATRQFLVEEFTAIMPAVHFSHLEFLSDRMTVSGQLRSITRYTRKTENRASVLSKITFEETVKRATEAAFKEHTDNMKGCSASVIVGKLPSTGAGMNELYFEYEGIDGEEL